MRLLCSLCDVHPVQANMRLSVWVLRTVVMHLTSTLHCRTTSSELCGVSEGEERERKNREGRGYKVGVCRGKGITSQKEEVGNEEEDE